MILADADLEPAFREWLADGLQIVVYRNEDEHHEHKDHLVFAGFNPEEVPQLGSTLWNGGTWGAGRRYFARQIVTRLDEFSFACIPTPEEAAALNKAVADERSGV